MKSIPKKGKYRVAAGSTLFFGLRSWTAAVKTASELLRLGAATQNTGYAEIRRESSQRR